MPLEAKSPSRVQETTTTSGTTSPLVLNGAVTKYRSFSSALTNGDKCYYSVIGSDGSEWENGVGTFTSPNLVSRDIIRESSNSNAIVNFSAGIKIVAITPSEAWGNDVIEESKKQSMLMTIALS